MKSDVQRRVGDVGNVALLLSTVLTSAMLIYRLPSQGATGRGFRGSPEPPEHLG